MNKVDDNQNVGKVNVNKLFIFLKILKNNDEEGKGKDYLVKVMKEHKKHSDEDFIVLMVLKVIKDLIEDDLKEINYLDNVKDVD